MSEANAGAWKRCSSCKGPIAFRAEYYVCSVSTCNRKRGGFFFCSVDCWDQHVPMMRHRDAWAVEEKAPSQAEAHAQESNESGTSSPKEAPASSAGSAPVRRRITVGGPAPADPSPAPKEILVIASRLKNWVRARYGMNTSDAVLEVLSDELRKLASRAAANAREDGRKTVLDRDFAFLRRPPE